MSKDGAHGRAATGVVVRVGATAMAVVVLAASAPANWLTVESPALHVALGTAVGLGMLVACWLTVLRVERTGILGDATLAAGIGILTVGSMIVAVLTLVVDVAADAVVTWIAVPGLFAAGGLFVAAGLLDRTPIAHWPGRPTFIAGTTLVALLLVGAGAGVGALGASPHIPLALLLLVVALFVAAAIALTRRAQWTGDSVLPWYAAGMLALAATRISGLLVDAPGESWVDLSDLVRLGAVGLLLMGGWTELGEGGHRTLENELELERHRLAREIHDGLAQELAFIVSQSRRLAGRAPKGSSLDLLARAGETALMDARRTIFSLKSPRERDPKARALSTAVAEHAFHIADRAGLVLDVEVRDYVSVAPEVEHAILRIIDESVSNAARHADATSVSIRISSENDRVVLRIIDDGRGLDARFRQRRGAFGLIGMTERAEALGGRLQLESEPGQGTVIEVAF